MDIISGKIISESVYTELIPRISKIKEKGITPCLTVILIGDNPASHAYVRSKTKKFKTLGLLSSTLIFKSTINQDKLIDHIIKLNKNINVHGILVQLPLPKHIDTNVVINSIVPEKDVDGFHPFNMGLLAIGKPRFTPCTPKGVMRLLNEERISIKGKHVVVIGRSNIVGRPLSILTSLKHPFADATTTICHSGTKNLSSFTKKADILISAIGIPLFIKGDMIKPGVVIIDVGINRIPFKNNRGYKLVGDVDWESINGIARLATPVPGGVGPMTIAMLVENTIESTELFLKKNI